MDDKFSRALKATFMFEGGFSDDPDDRGGATNMGITRGTLSRAKVAGWVPKDTTIQTRTREQAAEIYRRGYWEPIHGEVLPSPVAEMVFDCAVNNGVGGAGRLLQRAINSMNLTTPLAVDGIIGPKTLAAVARIEELNRELAGAMPELGPGRLLRELALSMLAYRAKYYVDIVKRNSTQKKFLYGWLRLRVVKLAELLGLIETA